MTRLARSRTASGSSVTSFEGNRSRSHTTEGRSRSHTADNQHGQPHAEGTANDEAAPKSAEVSC